MGMDTELRPDNLELFAGNKTTVTGLASLLGRKDKKTIPHTFLFTGQSGCGKTTLSRIVYKELGGNDKGLIEINSANNRGIDTAREIINSCKTPPLFGKIKAFLLDEVHQTSKDFQNALLKITEDAPSYVYFLLSTTDPDKLIKPLRKRCSVFTVNLLNDAEAKDFILGVVKKKKIKTTKELMKKLIEVSGGEPRTILIYLDMIRDVAVEDQLAVLGKAEENETLGIDLCRKLLSAKKDDWPKVSAILLKITEDPEKVRRMVLGYFTTVLLRGGSSKGALILDCFSENYYNTGKAGLVLSCYNVVCGE